MEYISLAIAVLALVFSAFSILENRRNNRIGQAPVIVGDEVETSTEYSYSITNKGNGPAYFVTVEYFLNLQPLLNQALGDVVREALTKNKIRFETLRITDLAPEGVMAAGEQICLGKVVFLAEDAEKFKQIEDAEFSFRITYRSSYGDTQVWASDDRLLR